MRPHIECIYAHKQTLKPEISSLRPYKIIHSMHKSNTHTYTHACMRYIHNAYSQYLTILHINLIKFDLFVVKMLPRYINLFFAFKLYSQLGSDDGANTFMHALPSILNCFTCFAWVRFADGRRGSGRFACTHSISNVNEGRRCILRRRGGGGDGRVDGVASGKQCMHLRIQILVIDMQVYFSAVNTPW